jgi:hypothetical protein
MYQRTHTRTCPDRPRAARAADEHRCRVLDYTRSKPTALKPPTSVVSRPGAPCCAVTELAIPALMAAVNALMCVIDLFQPSTWDAQFECSARRRSTPSHPTAQAQRRPRTQSSPSASAAPTRSPTCSPSPPSR